MKIGIDYWNTLTAYPEYFDQLCHGYRLLGFEVHIISAIGKSRQGTIQAEIDDGYKICYTAVHEVVFDTHNTTPGLKLAKCQELGITVFYDDRQDVVDLLNANGILAFKVPPRINIAPQD